MVKILVCGYGSIGKKHAQNLKLLQADIKIWRNRMDQEASIEKDGFIFEPSIDMGIEWCDGVVVATATDSHISIARKAVKMGKAVYLEKPISVNYDGVGSLLKEASGLIVEVGCQMRHHPNLKLLYERIRGGEDGKVLAFQAWVGHRLDRWRPDSDYKRCYSADAKRGGGALFDLVHEIDLIVWIVGSMDSVYADLRHNSDLDIKAEDLANLVLVAQNGAAGTVQLDMLSPAYRRGLQIICDKAVYRWDMMEGKLWRFQDDDPPVCISKVADGYVPANMLLDAMAHFLKRMEDNNIPASCSLEEAAHDLKILLAARKSNETGQKQTLGDCV